PRQARYWPLPGIDRVLPGEGTAGSFWEDRGDRHHAGIDLYAPAGSPVVAIGEGTVSLVSVFTSPDFVPYWNRTCEVTIAHAPGILCRYAELGDVTVDRGTRVRGGDVIGHVGQVLNLPLVGPDAPPYIRSLKERGRGSMLHLEVYASVPGQSTGYRGGNWFTREKPANLLDPALLLRDTL
ncbi:MAG: M23 family metallopeptidase, partial [Methanomicrobiales archaeon]|nr:M23 family metallopeptidase [Methanomicrobiales archaeon]